MVLATAVSAGLVSAIGLELDGSDAWTGLAAARLGAAAAGAAEV